MIAKDVVGSSLKFQNTMVVKVAGVSQRIQTATFGMINIYLLPRVNISTENGGCLSVSDGDG